MKSVFRLAAACLFCVTLSVDAQPLNFASPGAPRSTLHTQVFEPWIEKVVADSQGALNIRTFYASPLGNYSNMYDRVLNGVVHIAFAPLAPIGGQFLKTDVASLPFEIDNALEGSIALWNLYEKGVISEEFENVKLLGLFIFPSAALHLADRPIRTLEDFRGIKLRTAGKTQSDTLKMLGGSPVTTAIGDTYQGLNRGVFDGAVMPWTGIGPFKLDEVTQYHLDAPLGSSTAMIFMNLQTYENLPELARQSIDANSGMFLTRWAGEHSDTDASNTRTNVAAQDNHVVETISTAEYQRWKNQLQPVIDNWVEKTADGEQVLAAFREEIRLIRQQ